MLPSIYSLAGFVSGSCRNSVKEIKVEMGVEVIVLRNVEYSKDGLIIYL
jgi:hypothetical protein